MRPESGTARSLSGAGVDELETRLIAQRNSVEPSVDSGEMMCKLRVRWGSSSSRYPSYPGRANLGHTSGGETVNVRGARVRDVTLDESGVVELAEATASAIRRSVREECSSDLVARCEVYRSEK